MKESDPVASFESRPTGRHVSREEVYGSRRWESPRRIPSFQDLVFVPQPLRLPTHPQEVNTAVRLGPSPAAQSLELAIPLILAVGESRMLSQSARIALAQASRLAGTAVHTHDLVPAVRRAANKIILQVYINDSPMTGRDLRQSEAVELCFDQEAGKSSHPKGINTNQSNDPGSACQSESPSEAELASIIHTWRQATDQRAPIIFSLDMGRVAEDIRFAIKIKTDILRMQGMPDPGGCPPGKVAAPLGIPTIGGLAAARRTLADHGWENRLDLVIGGGIRDGAQVAKALALGAKAVAVGREALPALGCTGCGSCRNGNCPQGIATQDPDLMKKLDIDAGAQRVYAFLTKLKEEVQQICAVMGKSDVAELGIEDMQALTIEASAMTGLPLVGTGRVF